MGAALAPSPALRVGDEVSEGTHNRILAPPTPQKPGAATNPVRLSNCTTARCQEQAMGSCLADRQRGKGSEQFALNSAREIGVGDGLQDREIGP